MSKFTIKRGNDETQAQAIARYLERLSEHIQEISEFAVVSHENDLGEFALIVHSQLIYYTCDKIGKAIDALDELEEAQ